MDEVDRAQAEEERYRQEALARRRRTLIPTGQCHYCGEALDRRELFCDLACATEYERENDIRTKQGAR